MEKPLKLISSKSTKSLLTYAGSIPFLLGAFLLIADIGTQKSISNIQHLLSVYGLVIGSFMAGTLWGQQLDENSGWQRYVLLCSNTIALALWAAFVIFSFTSLMVAYAISFLALLLVDYQLSENGISNVAYFKLRFRVTIIVVLAIGISALAG